MTPAKVVHLIERVSDPQEILRQVKAFDLSDALVLDLTAGHVDAFSTLSSNGLGDSVRVIQAADLAEEVAEPSRQAYVRWVGAAGETRLRNGQTLKEAFTYDDRVSLWWFTNTAKKGQNSSPYRWLFFAFGAVDQMIGGGAVAPGATWHLWSSDASAGRALAGYLGDRGHVQIHAESVSGSDTSTPWKKGLRALGQMVPALRLARHLKARQRFIGKPFLEGENSGPSVLVATRYPKSWTTAASGQRFHEDVEAFDMYMGAMPWDLQDLGMAVAWVQPSASVEEFERWAEAGAGRQTLPDASPWARIGPAEAGRLTRSHVRWLRSFNRLLGEGRAEGLFTYRGADLGYQIVRDYQSLCGGGGLRHFLVSEQFRCAVRSLRPDAVIYRDEFFLEGRQVGAGVRGEAKLIAVQHGVVSKEYTVYSLDPDEAGGTAPVGDLIASCPAPDVFAAFGEHTHELFRAWGGYNADRVVPIGGVRHDDLVRRLGSVAGSEEKTAAMRVAVGLPLDRPVILLCTRRKSDVSAWFELLVLGIRAAGLDLHVAVKTHQYHGGDEVVHEVAQRLHFSSYSVEVGNTYELIACSDLVVSGLSTIVLEAYLLSRPPIAIMSTDGYETYPYRSEQIGSIVATADEMATALRSAFSTSGRERFREEREHVCRRHLWNHDGGAVERLAALLTGVPSLTEDHVPSGGS